jgi:Ca-activated chloride channel family protein
VIWEASEYLWLLLVIPLVWAGLRWWERRKESERKRWFADELLSQLKRFEWLTGERIRKGLMLVALAFLITGLAGPKIGTEVREVKQRGINMLIAMDLSSSMNAEDIQPSRLDKAKYEISRLIDRLEGDRIGLVTFTGEAFLQAPMTLDYSALRMFLNIANTDQMPSSTTDLGAAMRTALGAFESIDQGNQQKGVSQAANVLLIISDGENQEQDYESDLEELTDAGVSVFTLGIGTVSGARIPLYDDTGNLLGFKRDSRGQVVTTRLKPETLQAIARQGNGAYYSIQQGTESIDPFLGRLDELEKGEFASQEYADFKNQYQWLVGIGGVLLIAGLLFSGYGGRGER